MASFRPLSLLVTCLALVATLLAGCGSGGGGGTAATSTGGSGVTSATSASAVAPASLSFTVQPSNFKTGAKMAPDVQVSLLDAGGNVMTTATNTVTLALGTNPGGATLGGTLSAAAVSGVATFTGLTVDKPANTYTLVATAGGVEATSNAFKVIRNLSFAAPVISATTGNKFNQQMVAAGDFNKDGKDDVVFADNDNARVLIGISKGDGSFTFTDAATANGTASVLVADFDGDGNRDVAAACSNGTASFLRGKGDGTFLAKVDVANGNAGGLSNITMGDFNKDGLLDAMMTDTTAGGITLFRNTGNFTFAFNNFASGGTIGNDIAGISAGDFNGDGNVDVTVVQVAGTNLSVWTSTGNANPALLFPAANIAQYAFGYPGNGDGAKGVVAADLNLDGKMDIAVADRIPKGGIYSSWVFINPGTGVFGTPVPYRVGSDAFGIFAADFDLDAVPDLGLPTTFGLDLTRGDFEVLLGNGNGTFQNAVSFLVTGADSQARGGAVGDFNGDGLPDGAAATDGAVLAIFLNTSK